MNKARQARYEQILCSYGHTVAKVCYVYASRQAPFDDLYQEVCINLWQGLDSYRGDAPLGAWIYRMAINTCITWHRSNRKHAAADSDYDQVSNLAADTADDFDHERYRAFQQMLAALDPLEKALITLYLDEHSYAEIAQITGLTTSNVGVRLHRIKDKLAAQGRKYRQDQ